MAVPKRLAGCKGCIYFGAGQGVCDYSKITGKTRVAQGAPLLPGGGCRLKQKGDKCMITTLFSGRVERRYRVTLPGGKVRYLKEEEYQKYKEDQS